MKALTLWRPWPWAIFNVPPERAKRCENRGWAPPLWIVGKQIAIHAGKRVDDEDAFDFIEEACDLRPPSDGGAEGIIGVALVGGGSTDERGPIGVAGGNWRPWFVGPVGWILHRVVALPEPVPCRGAQGLWNLPDDVERAVRAQLPMTAPAPSLSVDPELAAALAQARGSWAIIRKGKRHKPPTVRRFRHSIGDEANARAAWAKLDVREGWALLVNPAGEVQELQSGPWGVRSRW